MAGYRPLKARGGGSSTNKVKLPKPTQENIEIELTNALTENVIGTQHFWSKRDEAKVNASLSNATKMADKAARNKIATSAAKGSAKIAKGSAEAVQRASIAFAQSTEKQDSFEGTKQATTSLARDAVRGTHNTVRGARRSVYGAVRDNLRVRRSARIIKNRPHALSMDKYDLVPVKHINKIWSKDTKGLTGALRRRQAQAAATKLHLYQLNKIGANSRLGWFANLSPATRRIATAWHGLVGGVRVMRRVAFAPAAIVGALTLLIPALFLGFMIFSGAAASDESAGTSLTSSAAVNYVEQAKAFAADNSIGYNTNTGLRQHNPDMDCSSLVYYALVESGVCTEEQLGPIINFASYTMADKLKRAGFQELSTANMELPEDLKYGDILQKVGHTEIYIGDGKNVGAWGNYDGRPGDSSGREVLVTGYWNDGWQHVYRLPQGVSNAINATPDAQSIWNWLKAKGYSDAAAAGVMGNAYAESELNPSLLQKPVPYAAGLFQWESYKFKSERWLDLQNYCTSKGKPWTDVTCQLEFMDMELQQILGKKGYAAFKLSTSPEGAARVFCEKFERPGIPRFEVRFNAAASYMSQFGGKL